MADMDRLGFTALELVIATGVVFGVMGGLMLMTTDAGNRVWARTDSQVATMTAAQMVLNRMREDLHAASLASLSEEELGCDPGAISFRRASDGVVIRYQLDAAAGTIRRTVGAATSVLAPNVSAMTFPTCDAATGVVRVALTTRVAPRRFPTATHIVESQMRVQNP
ncbi:MAG: hypothetical protein HYT90_05405 [Candidatus Omnitrophica bacterium]|nr:hypothetical protein [Candidatus Omnitrophota bacterium]